MCHDHPRYRAAAMILAAALVIVAVAIIGGREGRAVQKAIHAWEYRVVSTFIPRPVLEKFNKDRTQVFSHPSLDGMGDEGWELVAAIGDADNSEFRQFYFKRPR